MSVFRNFEYRVFTLILIDLICINILPVKEVTLSEFQAKSHDWQWNIMWDEGKCLLSKIVDDAYVITLFKIEGIYVVSAVNRRERDPFFFESFDAHPDVLEIKGQPF